MKKNKFSQAANGIYTGFKELVFWSVIAFRLIVISVDRFILAFLPWHAINKTMDVLQSPAYRTKSYLRVLAACVLFLCLKITILSYILLVIGAVGAVYKITKFLITRYRQHG